MVYISKQVKTFSSPSIENLEASINDFMLAHVKDPFPEFNIHYSSCYSSESITSVIYSAVVEYSTEVVA